MNVLLACIVVMVNPILWNVAARLEYRTRAISKLCRGPRRGVTVVAAAIMGLNFLRTSLFHSVMDQLSVWDVVKGDVATILGYVLIASGGVLVLASTWRLGFFCTFLGDYFGILLEEKVTGFPFNIVEDPMYVGSVFIYLGASLQHASIVGFVLTLCIGFSYFMAVQFEGPFTTMIYKNKIKSS